MERPQIACVPNVQHGKDSGELVLWCVYTLWTLESLGTLEKLGCMSMPFPCDLYFSSCLIFSSSAFSLLFLSSSFLSLSFSLVYCYFKIAITLWKALKSKHDFWLPCLRNWTWDLSSSQDMAQEVSPREVAGAICVILEEHFPYSGEFFLALVGRCTPIGIWQSESLPTLPSEWLMCNRLESLFLIHVLCACHQPVIRMPTTITCSKLFKHCFHLAPLGRLHDVWWGQIQRAVVGTTLLNL